MVTSCSSTVRLLPCMSTMMASKSATATRNTGQKERRTSRPNSFKAPMCLVARLGVPENSHSKNERRFLRARFFFFFAAAFFSGAFFSADAFAERLRRTGMSCSSPYWESSSSAREPVSGTSGRFSSSRMQTKLL